MSLSPSVQSLLNNAANAYGVSPGLLSAIALEESGGNQGVVGSSGEIGVMQLMPSTAASLGVDPTDISQNIAGGAAYYAQLQNEFGDTAMALAAYNAGPTTVANAVQNYGSDWMADIPASTQNYVSNVLANSGVASTSEVPGGISTPDDYSDVSYSSSGWSTWEIVAAAAGVGLLIWILV